MYFICHTVFVNVTWLNEIPHVWKHISLLIWRTAVCNLTAQQQAGSPQQSLSAEQPAQNGSCSSTAPYSLHVHYDTIRATFGRLHPKPSPSLSSRVNISLYGHRQNDVCTVWACAPCLTPSVKPLLFPSSIIALTRVMIIHASVQLCVSCRVLKLFGVFPVAKSWKISFVM